MMLTLCIAVLFSWIKCFYRCWIIVDICYRIGTPTEDAGRAGCRTFHTCTCGRRQGGTRRVRGSHLTAPGGLTSHYGEGAMHLADKQHAGRWRGATNESVIEVAQTISGPYQPCRGRRGGEWLCIYNSSIVNAKLAMSTITLGNKVWCHNDKQWYLHHFVMEIP